MGVYEGPAEARAARASCGQCVKAAPRRKPVLRSFSTAWGAQARGVMHTVIERRASGHGSAAASAPPEVNASAAAAESATPGATDPTPVSPVPTTPPCTVRLSQRIKSTAEARTAGAHPRTCLAGGRTSHRPLRIMPGSSPAPWGGECRAQPRGRPSPLWRRRAAPCPARSRSRACRRGFGPRAGPRSAGATTGAWRPTGATQRRRPCYTAARASSKCPQRRSERRAGSEGTTLRIALIILPVSHRVVLLGFAVCFCACVAQPPPPPSKMSAELFLEEKKMQWTDKEATHLYNMGENRNLMGK